MDVARSSALEVLRRVSTQGAFAGAALRALLPETASSADRGLATELVYGVLRYRGQLDRALRKAAGRRLKDLDPRLHDVLRLGAYQVMHLRIPAHAAVHATVELAKGRAGGPGGRRANQILRRLSETPEDERVPPPPSKASDPVAFLAATGSVNVDVAKVLMEALGLDQSEAYLKASLQPAPHVLRLNPLRGERAALIDAVGGTPGQLAEAVVLPSSLRALPGDLDAVRNGLASPQDEASMQVVELLAPEAGERILDVCAAPGGKTCHAAERMKDEGEVVAHDRLPARLRRVETNAARLGLNSVRLAEVLPEPEPVFDRVLVDAPCSGLGTLRRHPEIRWRFRQDDLETLTRTQTKVLRAGAERVRPGGVLVYSVCTVTRAEGPDHVADLGGFVLEESLRTGPHLPGAPDGFFAARLRKL